MSPELRSLTIWRDSVHAGDDTDAPHEISLPIIGSETLESVINRIIAAKYLASIHGGKATWIVESAQRPLGVVAQQWSQPQFLVAPQQIVTSLISRGGECHLNFRYWCQTDPDQVFDCLKSGKALPSKYG